MRARTSTLWMLLALLCANGGAYAHRHVLVWRGPPLIAQPVPQPACASGRASCPSSEIRASGAASAEANRSSPSAPTNGTSSSTGSTASKALASISEPTLAVAPASPAERLSGAVPDTAIGMVFRTSAHGLIRETPHSDGAGGAVSSHAVDRSTDAADAIYLDTSDVSSMDTRTPFLLIGNCPACATSGVVELGARNLNFTAFQAQIAAAARAYGVDEWLVRAVIHAESGYDPSVVSSKGAEGLMQLMPATAARFGVHDPFAVADNIDGGVRYLAYLSRRYRGDVELIAAAYNAGEQSVDRYGGVPPFAETRLYVQRVAALARGYRGEN